MKLTKRTTMLFDPDLWRQLERLAGTEHTSVAHLVRRAVIERYFLTDRKRRVLAAKALASVGGPVGDWQEIERQIMEGAIGRRSPR